MIVEGTGVLHYHDTPIDIERWQAGGYSDDEIDQIVSEIKTKPVPPGTLIHVFPGWIHRIEAKDEPVTIHEVSTTELDDVIRLQDDSGRTHGRIDAEH